MHLLSALLISSFSLAVLGQNLGDLPECAQQCVGLGNTITVPGCPDTLDIDCICGNEDYLQQLSCCLLKSCDPGDQQNAVKFAGSLCKTAGVKVPSDLTCPGEKGGSSKPSSGSPTSSGASQSDMADPTSTASSNVCNTNIADIVARYHIDAAATQGVPPMADAANRLLISGGIGFAGAIAVLFAIF
ncbi:MAG: hypothetical protein M1837_006771 [Sclerophora amabilis]|nr:MAG: hypothetical protein M1837_006771 [Sclerophora amabilis]